MNRHQQDTVDFLREENRILRAKLGPRRLRFNDRERRRLAIRGKVLGLALLAQGATHVSPDTIIAWHRRLVAKRWSYPTGRHGSAEEMKTITQHVVAPNTVCNIRRRHGIEPAPARGKHKSWTTFLKSQMSDCTTRIPVSADAGSRRRGEVAVVDHGIARDRVECGGRNLRYAGLPRDLGS